MSTHIEQRRPVGALGRMGVVAGIHAAAFYLIATGLGIVPPLIPKTEPIRLMPSEITPTDDPPPIPQPGQFDRPEITVPVPVLPPDSLPSNDEGISARATDDPPPIPDVFPTPPGPVLVGVRPDARHPLSQPAYPSIDVRLGNEGSVELEIYVLPNGRIGDARVLKSAGSATLDQSAVDEAKRRWRMTPATQDGVPVAQWHRLRVVFNLKDR
jgi:periplasmic protein TonB